MMKLVTAFAIIISVIAVYSASATIINIPGDYTTIQAGINASSNGDIVRVAEGTYVENINFNGKNIVVGSWFLDDGDPSYILSTIIDGGSSGSVVTFENGEDNTAIITGFTIQNGDASRGGGIYCYYNSNPTISDNTISGNSCDLGGGGIYCDASSPAISNNTISENSTGDTGGGVYCYNSNPTISNNVINGNSATNSAGGIYCESSSPTISSNTISENSATDYGGGILCYYSSPVITNNIFWANSAAGGPEIYVGSGSSPVITYCDIQGGWAGETNIDCDPLFCDSDNGNFYLNAASCCVGAGEGGVDIGAFGVGCGDEIMIEIFTDAFPSETTWEIADQASGEIFCAGGPYTGQDFTLITEICYVSADGCYVFTIYDVYGDGICCDAGDGYYNVYLNGELQGSGGEFEFEESIHDIGNGCEEEDVPTLSEWGMLLMALLLLAFGTVAVVRRRKVVFGNAA